VLFAFILLYFLNLLSLQLPASLTVVRKRTDYTRNESSREHSLPGMKVLENIRSQEQKFPGIFVPWSEGSHWELLL